MKLLCRAVLVGLSISACTTLLAQVPVSASPNQDLLLSVGDARAVANKRLVYDFWREVFEGGHMEFAEKYMAQSYVQHNPNVPTGRAAFVEFFGKYVPPRKSNRRSRPRWLQSSQKATWWSLSSRAKARTRRTQPRHTRPLGSTCSASWTER